MDQPLIASAPPTAAAKKSAPLTASVLDSRKGATKRSANSGRALRVDNKLQIARRRHQYAMPVRVAPACATTSATRGHVMRMGAV